MHSPKLNGGLEIVFGTNFLHILSLKIIIL